MLRLLASLAAAAAARTPETLALRRGNPRGAFSVDPRRSPRQVATHERICSQHMRQQQLRSIRGWKRITKRRWQLLRIVATRPCTRCHQCRLQLRTARAKCSSRLHSSRVPWDRPVHRPYHRGICHHRLSPWNQPRVRRSVRLLRTSILRVHLH